MMKNSGKISIEKFSPKIQEKLKQYEQSNTTSLTIVDEFKKDTFSDIIEYLLENFGDRLPHMLEFNFCNIKKIPDNIAKLAPTLISLRLAHNPIQKIPHEVLLKLVNMSEFTISTGKLNEADTLFIDQIFSEKEKNLSESNEQQIPQMHY